MRRIADLKSRLQRTNPVDHPTDYNRMFGELVALEQHRRTLRDRAVGHEAGEASPRTAPAGRGRAGGAAARLGGDQRPARCSPAPARRSTSTAPAWRGSTSRPPTGTATPSCSGSRGRPLGRAARRARLRPRRAGPAPRAGPRAGHRQRACCSATSRSTAGAAYASSPAGHPRATRARAGSTSTTRASTPTIPDVRTLADAALARRATRSGSSDRADFGPFRTLLTCAAQPARSPVAQLAEHSAVNRRVVGSSPTGGAIPAGQRSVPGWDWASAVVGRQFGRQFGWARARRRSRRAPPPTGREARCGHSRRQD